MSVIKYQNKDKENIFNIKNKNYNLIIYILFILIITSEESKYKLNKVNLDSEIIIHIKG